MSKVCCKVCDKAGSFLKLNNPFVSTTIILVAPVVVGAVPPLAYLGAVKVLSVFTLKPSCPLLTLKLCSP